MFFRTVEDVFLEHVCDDALHALADWHVVHVQLSGHTCHGSSSEHVEQCSLAAARRALCSHTNRCQVLLLSPMMPNTKLTMSRSEEPTSELQSLMRISYAVFCLKK